MKTTKNQFLSAVKNKVLLVGPMAIQPPPEFGPTLFVDGGTKWQEPSSNPQLSLGDGDSGSRNLDLMFSAKKDASDLSLALDLLPYQSLKIWLWGFLGGEKAHELANFGKVAHWLDGRPSSAALFDYQLFIVAAGSWRFTLHGEFSLISFVSNRVTITGACEFPLTTETPVAPLSSFGISNKASGVIQLTCRHPLMVIGRENLDAETFSSLVSHTALP